MFTFQRDINILIACLGVTLPSIAAAKYSSVEIVPFDDECVCISKLLSIKDKLIYLVVVDTLWDCVVPLIHNHRCIEHIYIYMDSGDIESVDWTKDYSKIRGNLFSIDNICKLVTEDIESMMQRPSRWSRSKALLAELCSQKAETDITVPIMGKSEDDMSTWRIVVLFLDKRRLLRLSHPKIKIDVFYDIERCMNSIKADNSKAVFLIVSVNRLGDVRLIAELETVHGVYIVTDADSTETIQSMSTYSKLSGIFALEEDLLEQLTTDICFYRQIRIVTPTVNVFKFESNILDKLTENQIDFLCFQLFIDILPQIPVQSNAATDTNTSNTDHLLSDLLKANMKISILFQRFDVSTLQGSVKELNDIERYMAFSTKKIGSSSATVYRAQLVSQKDLEQIQNGCNTLLTMQAFVVASRSFRSVLDICRRAVDNQLTVVLFEFKLSDQTSLTELDLDTVVFSLGTLFRIITVDSAPDGVWRALLESIDGAMLRIKDQLQIEIGGYLTWLTFGNYMTALRRPNYAKNYYQYLLLALPNDHSSLASIFNNMGLMYAEMDDDEEALKWFMKASELHVSDVSMLAEQSMSAITDLAPHQSACLDNITILNKIAEIYYREGDYEMALAYYRRARDTAIDASSRHFYQAKIETVLVSNDDRKT